MPEGNGDQDEEDGDEYFLLFFFLAPASCLSGNRLRLLIRLISSLEK